jgi:hypothetical protein
MVSLDSMHHSFLLLLWNSKHGWKKGKWSNLIVGSQYRPNISNWNSIWNLKYSIRHFLFKLKWKHFGFQFEIQIDMKTCWISIWNSNWNENILDFNLKFQLNWKQFGFQYKIQIEINTFGFQIEIQIELKTIWVSISNSNWYYLLYLI